MNKLLDFSPTLSCDGKRRIQEVVDVFLYHARQLNSLVTLSSISTQHATPTDFTGKGSCPNAYLLCYLPTYSSPILHFCASDMVLRAYSDVSYLSVSKDRSRAAVYFYISSIMTADSNETPVKPSTTHKLDLNTDPVPLWNSAIHVMSSIIAT